MSFRGRRSLVWATLWVTLFGPGAANAASTVLLRAGDASLAVDAATSVWVLSAGGAALTLRADASTDFAVTGLSTSSAKPWVSAPAADTVATVNGTAIEFGRIADGFVFVGVDSSMSGSTLRLDVAYDLPASSLRLTRHYAVAAGVPAFEVWTSFDPLAPRAPAIASLNALRVTVPTGTVRYVNGLQGDSADVVRDNAFSLSSRTVNNGEHVTYGATGRSSETTVPWIAVDGASDEFYCALLWSGAWSLALDRRDSALTISMGLASMVTTPGLDRIDSPHAVFGVVRGALPQATAAARTCVSQSLRGGRPLSPLVTYNTWFAYGVAVDEASMKAEIDRVAALGAELFVLDAGWYTNAGRSGTWDFTSGLGSWQVDRARFPTGLGALATGDAHRCGEARLPQMGQQYVGQLQRDYPRAWCQRRQLRAREWAVCGVAGAA